MEEQQHEKKSYHNQPGVWQWRTQYRKDRCLNIGHQLLRSGTVGEIATETGFSKDFIEEAAEYSTAKNSLLFNLVMNRSLHGRTEPSPADTIYFAQAKIIKNLAERESCVIVGRCGDYILRDNSDCLHIFIYSDMNDRAKRILERYGENEKPIQKRIADKDTRRNKYRYFSLLA